METRDAERLRQYKQDERRVAAERQRRERLESRRDYSLSTAKEQERFEEERKIFESEMRRRDERAEAQKRQLRELMSRYVEQIQTSIQSVELSPDDRRRLQEVVDRLPEPYRIQLSGMEEEE